MKRPGFKNNWFIDKDSEYRFVYNKIKKHLLSKKTRFQKVDIIDTKNLGRAVILDEKVQSSESDEFIYHEALVHPAMITHPNPERILILGGGEGATLREVLKHPTVQKVVMVDIDKEFVNICKRYLKKWHKGSFNNRKVNLLFLNAMEYMENNKNKFDVIIADISDPLERGPASIIYTNAFYALVKKALESKGIFVTHATEVHYTTHKKIADKIFTDLKKIYPIVKLYFEYIPSFICLWGFAIASLKYNPENVSLITIQRRLRERNIEDLLYYDAEIHGKMFALPTCIRRFFL